MANIRGRSDDGSSKDVRVSAAGEIYMTSAQSLSNKQSNFGASMQAEESRFVCMVSLRDGRYLPKGAVREKIDHAEFTTLSLNITKAKRASGLVALGVITALDSQKATITLFFGKNYGTTETVIDVFRNFHPSIIRCDVENGAAKSIVTTAVLRDTTAINDTMKLDSAFGPATISPQVGDVVLWLNHEGGGKATIAVQSSYNITEFE